MITSLFRRRGIRAVVAVGLMTQALAPGAARADELETALKEALKARPDIVEQALREALARNPEILRSAILEALKQRGAQLTPQRPPAAAAPQPAPQPDRAAAIAAHAGELFTSPRQVTLGNPDAKVVLVEFFDYNCGYCRRAAEDKYRLLAGDADLKVVLKELPILGPQSLEAAEVAVAVHMQDSVDGRLYQAFNRRMFGQNEPASRSSAMANAERAGADMERLKRDLSSPDIRATLTESVKLARALGITGTPSYVLGQSVIAGAVGAEELARRIQIEKTRVN